MNILMSANGRAFLADFGIAKFDDTPTYQQTTESVTGTKFWKAPELFNDVHAHATEASDMYTFGMICYEVKQFANAYEKRNRCEQDNALTSFLGRCFLVQYPSPDRILEIHIRHQ